VDGPAAAFAAIDAHSYDVLVTDLVMGGEAQLEFLSAIAAREDTPAVIVVTAYPSIESAVTAVDLGLMGYLQKPFEAEDLIKRIEDALERRRYASLLSNMESSLREASEQLRNVSRLAEARPGHPRGEAPPVRDPLLARQLETLTPREREILDELMDGYRISTVARRLEISPHTVRRHLKHIFAKLEVRSQAELLEKLKP
jgi:DNA-binding NarL/FixJ family response regulator